MSNPTNILTHSSDTVDMSGALNANIAAEVRRAENELALAQAHGNYWESLTGVTVGETDIWVTWHGDETIPFAVYAANGPAGLLLGRFMDVQNAVVAMLIAAERARRAIFTCSACGGTGGQWVGGQERYVPCTACNGTGLWNGAACAYSPPSPAFDDDNLPF